MYKKVCAHLCLLALLLTAWPAQAQEKAKEPTVAEKARPAVPLTQNGEQNQPSNSDTIIIPEGTEIQLTLRDPVSSKLSEVGDEVYATVRRDVVVEGRTLLQEGTEVIGRVTLADPAKRLMRGGRLHLAFERIRLASGERRLTAIIKSASDFERDEKIKSDGEGTLKGGKDGGKVLQNMGTVAGIGGAATSILILAGTRNAIKNGTGIGTGTLVAGGAILGGSIIASVLLSKGKEVRLDQNAIIRLKLERALAMERYQ